MRGLGLPLDYQIEEGTLVITARPTGLPARAVERRESVRAPGRLRPPLSRPRAAPTATEPPRPAGRAGARPAAGMTAGHGRKATGTSRLLMVTGGAIRTRMAACPTPLLPRAARCPARSPTPTSTPSSNWTRSPAPTSASPRAPASSPTSRPTGQEAVAQLARTTLEKLTEAEARPGADSRRRADLRAAAARAADRGAGGPRGRRGPAHGQQPQLAAAPRPRGLHADPGRDRRGLGGDRRSGCGPYPPRWRATAPRSTPA